MPCVTALNAMPAYTKGLPVASTTTSISGTSQARAVRTDATGRPSAIARLASETSSVTTISDSSTPAARSAATARSVETSMTIAARMPGAMVIWCTMGPPIAPVPIEAT